MKPFEVFTVMQVFQAYQRAQSQTIPGQTDTIDALTAELNAILNERGKRVYGFNDSTGAYTFDRHIDEDNGDTHEALLIGEREIE